MSTVAKSKTTVDDTTPVGESDVLPSHRLWMNEQIERALEKKRDGTATYETLEQTRRKFGF